jgi:REP element-mobilizing transposase RayT
MPRKVRIEFAGALYHIVCRGDRREEIFQDDKDRELFLSTLGQVCERCGFIVHSYVLMRNHYHLLLETPAGNLVAGMKWFQGTYSVRFNTRHRLTGHLFAGRYKAVLVEREEPSYGRVVSDYIHLNPARAGLVNGENPRLGSFRWSSFPPVLRESGSFRDGFGPMSLFLASARLETGQRPQSLRALLGGAGEGGLGVTAFEPRSPPRGENAPGAAQGMGAWQ